MITVYVKQSCGCCTSEMQFEHVESATAAFQKAGLGDGIVITDDSGVRHEGLDTFYGFSTEQEAQESRSLGYLFGLVAEKTQ